MSRDGAQSAAPGARSMTGFGSATCADAEHEVRVEIRAVNHRGLTLRCSLGSEMAETEAKLEGLVRARCARGAIQLQVRTHALGSAAPLDIDEERLGAYAEQLFELSKKHGYPQPHFSYLLGLPGVSRVQSAAAPEASLVLRAVDEALDALLASRAREGARLRDEILAIVRDLRARVERIATRWPEVVREYSLRLEKRVRDFLAQHGQSVDSVDLLREVAIWADKADVAEEVTRFKTHLDEVARILAEGELVGRRLEFLGQELLREANTMAAKSSDVELARDIVEIKSGLDRVREQGQNLE